MWSRLGPPLVRQSMVDTWIKGSDSPWLHTTKDDLKHEVVFSLPLPYYYLRFWPAAYAVLYAVIKSRFIDQEFWQFICFPPIVLSTVLSFPVVHLQIYRGCLVAILSFPVISVGHLLHERIQKNGPSLPPLNLTLRVQVRNPIIYRIGISMFEIPTAL